MSASRSVPSVGVRGVVFDYGGVLTTPVGDSIRAWLARAAIEPSSFSRTLKEWLSRDAPSGTPVHRLETGALSVDEFNVLLAERLVRLDGSPVEPDGLLKGLFADVRPDPAMIGLVERLSANGVEVALLSNSWGSDDYPWDVVDRLFRTTVISGRDGVRKPDRESFALVLDRMGLGADVTVFVDDAEPNVLGARRVGMRAIHHVDAASTRAELEELIPALTVDLTEEST
ncbi:HAD family hydrolase [Longivirga aurantiaca]|uniref:HAD family hydrolase n=1 Tax=Longivirga aurantiaca TaxID=1837743 RepID=A0ABW1T448_9ACTN